MPFDNTPVEVESPNKAEIALLDGMIGILGDPRRWCKGAFQLMGEVGPSYCLGGALMETDGAYGRRKQGSTSWEALSAHAMRVWTQLRKQGRRDIRVEAFNDNPRTTHVDILNLLQRTKASLS